METSIKITLIIVSSVIALALIGGYLFMQIVPEENTISSQGYSTVKTTPDLITIYFNVQTKGSTSKEANDNNSEIVDNVLTELIKLGLEREDIVTENFNVYPLYNWNNGYQQIIGYQATHNIKVELSAEDTDKIGDIIDAGVDAGALISYINFALSQEKQNEYKAEALKLASEDAKIKAEATVEGVGKSLGKLVSISSSNFNYYPWDIYRTADSMGSANVEEVKQATTNIQPGEQEISASVSVVYRIR